VTVNCDRDCDRDCDHDQGKVGVSKAVGERRVDLVIEGGHVAVGSQFIRGDITVADGKITAIEPVGTFATRTDVPARHDATGCFVVPGFVELQINGFAGIDFTAEPHRMGEVAAMLPRFGITSFLPTVVTSTADSRTKALAAWRATTASPYAGAQIAGLHFEGPFLSPTRTGAHDSSHRLLPSAVAVSSWTVENGVRLVTMAPELDGAVDTIAALRHQGVVVLGGHTEASALVFQNAVKAGLMGVTHLFNAMAPLSHRAPGPIAVVLADNCLVATLIADGVHVDPLVVAMVWKLLGAKRLILVSDAAAATGQPASGQTLGTQKLVVRDGAIYTSDGVLAGSAVMIDQCLRNLMNFAPASLIDVIGAVTSTPSSLVGLTDRGTIEINKRADIVILDAECRVMNTFVGGFRAFSAS
jgi:N-acetylglucosamine-6-phosphate deacetylase